MLRSASQSLRRRALRAFSTAVAPTREGGLPQGRTMRHYNGEKEPLGIFSPAEYDRRLATLRGLMAEQQMDAVLFTSIHNVNYFSGFLYCSFGRPYGMLVTHDDPTTTTFSAGIDGGQ
eukprot:1397321-Prymnesium_polylepis.1